MDDYELDIRELPPAQRHPTIMKAFEELDGGEALTLINDHEPKPLYHQMKAEIEAFNAEGYEVTQESDRKFVATLPKQ